MAGVRVDERCNGYCGPATALGTLLLADKEYISLLSLRKEGEREPRTEQHPAPSRKPHLDTLAALPPP